MMEPDSMNVDEVRKTPISDTDSENDEDCRRTNDSEFLQLAPLPLVSSSSSSGAILYSSLPVQDELQHDAINDLRMQGKGAVPNKNKRQKIALSLPTKKDIRKYYQHDAVNRHTPSNVTLLPPTVKSKCWVSYVWCHFKKFHPVMHPELKNLVACDICFKEAENNQDIDFTVQYQDSSTSKLIRHLRKCHREVFIQENEAKLEGNPNREGDIGDNLKNEASVKHEDNSLSSSAGASLSAVPVTDELGHINPLKYRPQIKSFMAKKTKKYMTPMSAKKEVRNLYQPDAVVRHTPSNVTLLPPQVKANSMVSYVWYHFKKFHPVEHPELKNLVACDICFKEAETDNEIDFTVQYQDSSTTKLIRHLRKCHREIVIQENEAKAEYPIAGGGNDIRSITSSQNALQLFLNWTVSTYQPLETCENPFFRGMLSSLNPKTKFFDQSTVEAALSEQYMTVKTTLKKILIGQKCSLTFDDWESAWQTWHRATTVHFIEDDYTPVTFTLCCEEFTPTVPASLTLTSFLATLTDYGISVENVVGLVTHPNPRLESFASLLPSNIPHLHCVDVVLEKIASLALEPPQLHRIITDARALAWHFLNDDVAMAQLLALQTGPDSVPLGVLKDIRAKWWTVYDMIVRLRELKSYLNLLDVHGSLHCNLTESGWDILKTIEILLEPLTIVQRALACQEHVTISLMPYTIAKVRNGLKKILSEFHPAATKEIAANMLEDPIRGVYTHWGKGDDGTIFEEVNARKRRQTQSDGFTGHGFSQTVLLAAALDPRTKVLAGIGKSDKEKIWGLLTQKMRMVRRESCVGMRSTVTSTGTGAAAAALRSTAEYPESLDIFCEIGVDSEDKIEGDGDGEGEGDGVGGREGQYYRLDEESKCIADNEISKELDMYIKTPLLNMKIQTEFSNPLAWWKIHKDAFPVLSVLARKYLCIPVTSASCKRVFTTEGLEASERRPLVPPKDIPRLLFLNDSQDAAEKYDIKFSENINLL